MNKVDHRGLSAVPRAKKNKETGEVFKKLLKEKEFSQYKLEQVTGLDKSVISKIATGQTANPTPTTLEKIAAALQIELGELTRIFAQSTVQSQHSATNIEPQESVSEIPRSNNSDFVGREEAIAHLNMLIEKCNTKAIGIYGKGGIGKTTLAYHYFETQKLEYLELQVGMEAQYMTSVKSWVKDQLRYQFKEEPQQDFMGTLEQLKRNLQNKPVGILIDNLETALDENGKFKKDHIDYLELFIRVLNAPNIKSITLITSRERVNEAKLSFVEAYQLPELDESAWRKFLSRFNINVNSPAMSAIHKSYGGNALCMKVLREPIQTKYNGDLEAYWQDNKEFLLKGNIKDLVASQFDRIQDNNIYAYNLLCRLGLYTYQKIPYIPIIGLLCLLWDVGEEKKRPIIDSLEKSHLLDFRKVRVENISDSWQDIPHFSFPSAQGWIFHLEQLQNKVKLLVFQPAGYSLCKIIWEEANSRLNLSNQSIDYLLLSLKDQVDKLLNSSEKLQRFLNFAYQKQQNLFCNFYNKQACIRSTYIELAIQIFGNLADAIDPFELENAGASNFMDMHSSIELDISFEIVQDINHILTFLYCLEGKSIFWEVSSTSDLSEIDFALEILPGIKRLLIHKLEINPELHKGLHYIQSLLPDNVEKIGFFRNCLRVYKPESVPIIRKIPIVSLKEVKDICECGSQLRENIEEFEEWFKINGQEWLYKIAEVMSNLPRINIVADWQLSEQEKQQLRQYYDANRLLVDCLNSASDEVRSHIEDTLLLPIAEIEKRPFKN
ncbi:helix-turn-helix domain-containing protein [Nostoc sp. LEGE 12447]|uniref:NACHT C-terminal helical domain 2-containing protein n=1 Tax=Nostoc sp. LEGE 12447 TaxID=1828640 RepID=UPI0018841D32|nr:helix-turn-helix domain-containing protein [Nostoc sp. LEGE 12447]MBE8998563.1 helix-turn-helix domain-containing protein [Nostoc sp. LEGE 12447]